MPQLHRDARRRRPAFEERRRRVPQLVQVDLPPPTLQPGLRDRPQTYDRLPLLSRRPRAVWNG